MLWIQYEASTPVERPFIWRAVQDMAKLTWPYPVAAFDEGKFGIGMIICDENVPVEAGPVSVDYVLSGLPAWDVGSKFDTALHGLDSEQWPTNISPNDGDVDAPPNISENDFTNPEPSQGSDGNGGKGRGDNDAKNKATREDGNDEDGHDDENHPSSGVAESPKFPKRRKFGTFLGSVRLSAENRLKQELEIRFDLQIMSVVDDLSSTVRCRIALHRLIISASRM
jgi:hypothetical protein